ncbi:transferase [Streptomyces sp. NPDC002668]|uniref:DapH/DapD/GlmU-related protein n=1 Tax=Streptomyces sp. NPDC002668 TaxID=3154422 RepID=UPI00332D4EF3
MPTINLGDYLTAPADHDLRSTSYGHLGTYELADFLAGWDELHHQALAHLPYRIHPTAYVHPNAIIGDDVVIGPHVQVWEFSTIRAGSVLCAGVSIGFNCEVTKSFIGEGSVLGHRIGINRALVGADAHLSANVTVAAISMWSPAMRRPEHDVFLRTPQGIYRCGTPQFGALIGDRVQTGNNISLGPGIALGRDCRITSGVTLAARTIPDHHTISAPHTADVHVRRRRQ